MQYIKPEHLPQYLASLGLLDYSKFAYCSDIENMAFMQSLSDSLRVHDAARNWFDYDVLNKIRIVMRSSHSATLFNRTIMKIVRTDLDDYCIPSCNHKTYIMLQKDYTNKRYKYITLFVNGHAASKLHYAYPDLKQSTNTTVKFMYLEVVKRNIRLSV